MKTDSSGWHMWPQVKSVVIRKLCGIQQKVSRDINGRTRNLSRVYKLGMQEK
jgi:hypothetical protein